MSVLWYAWTLIFYFDFILFLSIFFDLIFLFLFFFFYLLDDKEAHDHSHMTCLMKLCHKLRMWEKGWKDDVRMHVYSMFML